MSWGDALGGWNKHDGNKDCVFELDLAPTTAYDLAAVKISSSGGGVWNTVAGDGYWAIAVTNKVHGHPINNADSSINTIDLASGLRIYVHVAGSEYVSGTIHVYACSSSNCSTSGADLSLVV